MAQVAGYPSMAPMWPSPSTYRKPNTYGGHQFQAYQQALNPQQIPLHPTHAQRRLVDTPGTEHKGAKLDAAYQARNDEWFNGSKWRACFLNAHAENEKHDLELKERAAIRREGRHFPWGHHHQQHFNWTHPAQPVMDQSMMYANQFGGMVTNLVPQSMQPSVMAYFPKGIAKKGKQPFHVQQAEAPGGDH